MRRKAALARAFGQFECPPKHGRFSSAEPESQSEGRG